MSKAKNILSQLIQHRALEAILLPLLLAVITSSAASRGIEHQPPSLFDEISLQESDVVDLSPAVLRSRPVAMKVGLLGSQEEVGKQSSSELLLNLFPDAQYTAVPEQVESMGPGMLIWHGVIEGVPDSTVTFALNQEAASGTIRVNDVLYKLSYAGDDQHTISQVEASEPLPELVPIPVVTAESLKPESLSTLSDDGSIIDSMVLYTPAARAKAGGTNGIVALVNLAIAESNDAYVNSNINTQLRLVHMAEVTYDESASMSTDLSRLRYDGDDLMDEIHDWRDAYGADVVTLIVDRADACGVAYIMTNLSNSFEAFAFSVVETTCATGYYSFAHELGHNMGSHHNRGAAPAPGPALEAYSYGYLAPDHSYRTIMAYNCPGGCTREKRFSNPDVSFGGHPTGIDHDVDPVNSADNARSINSAIVTVANWRENVVPLIPPLSPDVLKATVVSPFQVDLNWKAADGDPIGYKIERTADGTNWSQVALVGVTKTAYEDFGLSDGTEYNYRVRAFNFAGNSGYSNVVEATTFPAIKFYVPLVTSNNNQ